MHGWTVYQLSIGDPLDEAEVLRNLGELLDAGLGEKPLVSVFSAVVSRPLPARGTILPCLGGLALASAASQQDFTDDSELAAREVLRFDPEYSPAPHAHVGPLRMLPWLLRVSVE